MTDILLQQFTLAETGLVSKQLSLADIENSEYEILADKTFLEKSLQTHLTVTTNWSNEVYFQGLSKNKKTNKIYTDFNCLTIRRSASMFSNLETTYPVSEQLRHTTEHMILLGNAGTGKTTALKNFLSELIALHPTPILISVPVQDGQPLDHSKTIAEYGRSMPFMIRLRDIAQFENGRITPKRNYILFRLLADTLGLRFKIGNRHISDELINSLDDRNILRIKHIIAELFEDLSAVIVLDGFDEVNHDIQGVVLEEIEQLSQMLKRAKIILSSRPAALSKLLQGFQVLELLPPGHHQVLEMARNWLAPDQVESFMNEVLAIWPSLDGFPALLIAQLLAVFDRYGRIPRKPTTLYRKFVDVMFEDWDSQRNISRISSFPGFGSNQKHDLLAYIAFELKPHKKVSYKKEEILSVINKGAHLFRLPGSEVRSILSELVDHVGIFVQTAFDQYSFVHKTIEEYLCACYIVKTPFSFIDSDLDAPDELAMAVALSEGPNKFYVQVVKYFFLNQKHFNGEYLYIFFSRLKFEKPDYQRGDLEILQTTLELYSKCVYAGIINETLEDLIISFINETNFPSFVQSYLSNNQLIGSPINKFTAKIYKTLGANDCLHLEEQLYENHVFISYNIQDREIAHKIIRQLNDYKIKTWCDETNLNNSDQLDPVIIRAIDKASVFLPILTENTYIHSQQPNNYRKEWNQAFKDYPSKIYAVYTDNYSPESINFDDFSEIVRTKFLLPNASNTQMRTMVSASDDYKLDEKFVEKIMLFIRSKSNL